MVISPTHRAERQRPAALTMSLGLALRCAVLGRLSTEVDLHEQLRRGSRFGRRGVDRIEQPPAVYGVNGAESGHGLTDLVRLERADQMPSDLKVGRSVDLL
jgi:hypothetical protein